MAYVDICKEQVKNKKSFFGLRDFYRYYCCHCPCIKLHLGIILLSLIKMLYWMCASTDCEPSDKQLEHAIKRNFGGLEELNAYEIFLKHLEGVQRPRKYSESIVSIQ